MKWTAKDIEQYYQEKEYIDTVVIPLLPVTWHKEIKSVVEAGEFTEIITEELEKQLRGRIVQFPPFTYLKSETMNDRLERLREWNAEILREDIKHIVYLTSDVEWKNNEDHMEGSLIWLPSVPLQHMEFEYQQEVVSSQLKQILEIVTNQWQNRHKNE